ncbi:MAG TPA: ATP-binding protein [Solirubrobacteraceae bacterium]|nr:ATP-binding protein [Solirubrobacteraceae bacterium]
MVPEPVRVRLELDSHPENVALVRSAVTGMAEALALDPELTADLKTALSEACNNVALHAYDDTNGPMVVELEAGPAGIAAAVIDQGSGITRISGGEDRMGLGLALISATASASEFRRPEGGGTEVRMWFRARDARDLSAELLATSRPVAPPDTERADSEILVSLAPPPVMRYVLGRIVHAVAALAHFSLARLSHLSAANEAISVYVEETAQERVNLAIQSSPRRLTVCTQAPPEDGPATTAALAALAAAVDGLATERDGLRIELVDATS